MADKNNLADENYLEDLLKAMEGEGTEDTSDNEDELSFENIVNTDSSEEEFLSDLEKDIFGIGELQENVDTGIESQADTEMKPGTESVPEEMLFDFGDDILEGLDDSGISMAGEGNETMELVNKAVDMGDSSVEENLQGLYDILGVDDAKGGLPENIEEKPKKKGLFGRKDKKEKKEKKEKKSKKSKKSAEEAVESDTVSDSTQNVDPALDGFDVEALFNSPGAFSGDGNEFDLSGSLSLDESGNAGSEGGSEEFSFGLDDSLFGATEENENDMLIRKMEEGDLDDEILADEDDGKGKKDKKKKEKKEKKEKKSKNKEDKKAKTKKPKKAKEPKVKKEKEPDEIIHIPIIALLFMISFIVVAVVAVKLGGDYYFYQEKIYAAVESYVETDEKDVEAYESRYSEAYSLLSGLEMRTEEHQIFYDQVKTIMFMDRHYEAYKGYMLLENFENGLDSLVKAVKMYDKYQNEARELGCFDDMTVVLSWVNDKLTNVYGITESRAREIYMITDDREYAIVVREIAAEAEAKYLESKIEEVTE